jgi:nucleoside-diphosphate-sugar epimerase
MGLWAITGGSGFFGIHLVRRLLADGEAVRTLDVEPLDRDLLEAGADGLVGDVRDKGHAARLCEGAEVLVHAAAALPINRSRAEIASVNVGGTANVLRVARAAGVRRAVFLSSTAVYGVPTVHPITTDTPLAPLGAYGESKVAAEEACRTSGVETTIIRPKTFIGPERLGVFEILFDWIREGRRIYVLGNGRNRYQLLAVEDLVDAVVRSADPAVAPDVLNVGAKAFATVAEDLQAVIDHADSSSRIARVPAAPARVALRTLELAHLSPLAEWHYRTADKDSFVDTAPAEAALGWEPRFSNAEALVATYDWYLANRERLGAGAGVTHRTPWRQQALGVLKRLS